MNAQQILQTRLINQQIAASDCRKPEDIVAALTAMQAQEYAQAKWAIGLRLPDSTHDQVEQALNDGAILRTHLMRPTWHFVAPADIRWMLTLTAPRVHGVNAYMYRKCELDTKLLNRCKDIIEKELEGGKQLTRIALNEALAKKKIIAEGTRLTCIMMYAELEQAICSGARQGKQFTYALLDERVPPVKPMDREEALVLLTQKYFMSRGPATVKDFSTWSGLTVTEARLGLAALTGRFEQFILDGETYYFTPPAHTPKHIQSTFLMPDYDEYGMSYKNRAIIFASTGTKLDSQLTFGHTLIVNRVVEGLWKRGDKEGELSVMPNAGLSKAQHKAIDEAIGRYKAFYK